MSSRLRSRRSILQALGVAGTGVLGLGSLSPTGSATRASDANDSSPGGWPSYHFDAGNTGYNPDGAGLGDPTYRWRTGLDRAATGPVVGDECVFTVQYGATVTALDRRSGAVRWIESVDGEVDRFRDETVLALADETLFATLGSCVYAFDSADGAVQWSHHLDAELSTPTVTNGTVFFATESGAFLAFEADSGEERWRFEDGLDPISMAGDSRRAPAVSPDGSTVYFVDGDSLYALDPADGTEQWRVEVGAYMAPVAGEAIYVTTGDAVRAYAPADGAVQWERTFAETVDTTPTVADGRVFVQHYPRGVRALDAATGETAWTTDLELADRRPTLVADGDNLYVPVQSTEEAGAVVRDEIVALDPGDGSERWRFTRRYVDTVGSEPVRVVAANDALYAVIDDRDLYRIDERPAGVRWRTEIGHEPDRMAVAGDGVVYAASTSADEGAIAAFEPDTGRLRWEHEDDVLGRPAANEEYCFYARPSKISALETADGAVGWRESIDGNPRTGIRLVDGTLYLGTVGESGVLYAIDAADGSRQWTVGADDCATSIEIGSATPAVVGDALFAEVDDGLRGYDVTDGTELCRNDQRVYALTGGPDVAVASWRGTVRAIAPDGTVQWTRDLASDVTGIRTVAGGAGGGGSNGLVVARTAGSSAGRYEALSLADGSTAWEFTADGGAISMPTLADETAYAAAGSGHLYGLDPETGDVRETDDAFHGLHDRPAVVDGTVVAPSDEGFLYGFEVL